MSRAAAIRLVEHEARALATRVAQLQPFAFRVPTVTAAALSWRAQRGIEGALLAGREELGQRIAHFLAWIRSPDALRRGPPAAQRRLTLLRLRFNQVLTEFDVFSDALTQRAEHGTGTWLAGLDAAARDALVVPGLEEPPPVVCYFDRGIGAAIRRARTRLPTGRSNPVAIVRIPRERMVGMGVASSLVHEVGHQGAALLRLVPSLRPILRGLSAGGSPAWHLWDRWLSEAIADLWSAARVGIAAPLGLLAVVSLPRAFVFRLNADDPHPMPWIRVKLSCAFGEALYPHAQWQALAETWEALYPLRAAPPAVHAAIHALERSLPGFVATLVNHRPRALGGRSLREALATPDRTPQRLSSLLDETASAAAMRRWPPSLVFAALGQARAEERLSPEREAVVLRRLLGEWALAGALEAPVRQEPRRELAVN